MLLRCSLDEVAYFVPVYDCQVKILIKLTMYDAIFFQLLDWDQPRTSMVKCDMCIGAIGWGMKPLLRTLHPWTLMENTVWPLATTGV